MSPGKLVGGGVYPSHSEIPGFDDEKPGRGYRGPSNDFLPNPVYESIRGEDYGWPPLTDDAIRTSIGVHNCLREIATERIVEPSESELGIMSAALGRAYPYTFQPPPGLGDPDWDVEFNRILLDLDKTSSTGLGYFAQSGSIGDALGWDGVRFTKVGNLLCLKHLVRQRLSAISGTLPQIAITDPRASEILAQMATQPVATEGPPDCDDIKLFVKLEPHKSSKLIAGRYRIIFCPSLVDQVVDRYLFSRYHLLELRQVGTIPTKVGWNPLAGGFRALVRSFERGDAWAVDKTAWDWTYPPWLVFFLCSELIARAVAPPDWWISAVFNRYLSILGPGSVLHLPSGRRLRQTFFGFMKSGWFRTLSDNSLAQFCQHVLAWTRLGVPHPLPYVWIMGDDLLMRVVCGSQELMDEYGRKLAATGCLVKLLENKREFAGFSFPSDEEVIPLYQDKHRFMLSHVNPDNEQQVLLSFVLLYALTPNAWIDFYSFRMKFPLSRRFRAWALGLVKLDLNPDLSFFKM